MKNFFLLLTLLLCTSMDWAHAVIVDGINYNIDQSNKTAQVISNYEEYTGDLCIPESISVEGTIYVVTSLGNRCFRGCTGLTSVTISNSVTSLESSCFYGCTDLTSIDIPNSVTSLGSDCFDGCTGLTSITIPNSVTSLGNRCFRGCTGLTSVTIPNSVTSLWSACFADCARLESIEVESGNTVYDSRENCNAIIQTSLNTMIAGCKNTTIPNSVTSLGSDCFEGCTGLTSITIPNSAPRLEDGCFSY